jgi:hypothetical protein
MQKMVPSQAEHLATPKGWRGYALLCNLEQSPKPIQSNVTWPVTSIHNEEDILTRVQSSGPVHMKV